MWQFFVGGNVALKVYPNNNTTNQEAENSFGWIRYYALEALFVQMQTKLDFARNTAAHTCVMACSREKGPHQAARGLRSTPGPA